MAALQAPGVDVSDAATATAQGRIGTPVEVAQAALPLASDTASFGNGAHLFVEKGSAAGEASYQNTPKLVPVDPKIESSLGSDLINPLVFGPIH